MQQRIGLKGAIFQKELLWTFTTGSDRTMSQRWIVNICPFLHFSNSRTHTYEHNVSIASWNVKSVLDYLDVHPDHKFCFDQVTLLEGFKRLFPNYWDALHQRILEGRIEIVGGTYVMPDLIIPDGESIARQFLFGKKFIHGELGINVRVGWAVDSAGHCAQLPQILRLCGLDSYYFWRGMPYDGPTEFVWKGPDGSRVNAIYLSNGFDSAAWLSENTREAFFRLLRIVEETGEKASSNNVFLPVGGELVPPLPHLNDIVTQWNTTFSDMRITIVTPGEFADKLKSVQADLPMISGSLDSGRFTGIRSGGLAARPKLKLMNRRLETLLYLSELYLSLANNVTKSLDLENIWKILLFNQDHNIIRGTLADEPYKLAKRRFEQAIEQAEQLFEEAVSEVSAGIQHNTDSYSFVVHNPTPWARSDVVRSAIDTARIQTEFFEIRDPADNSVPYQIVSEVDENPIEIILHSKDIPSLGHRVYSVIGVDKRPEFDSSLKTGKTWIESNHFILEFDDFNGSISRLYDKKNQTELLRETANHLLFENDVGDLYRHSTPEFVGESPGLSTLRFPAKIDLVESGPVRSVFEVISEFEGSTKKDRIIVYDDIHRIDFEMDLDFKARNKRVRLNFPLTIFTDRVRAGSQFGSETKINVPGHPVDWNDKTRGLFSALDWVDCCGPEIGLCFSAPGLHEFEFRDGILKVTLLRSVDYLSRGYDDDVTEALTARERGSNNFRYTLYPHEGDWIKGSSWQVSTEHRLPLIAYPLDGASGALKIEQSNLKVEGIDLMLSCFKPKKENEFIVRLYEPKGMAGTSKITFHREIDRVEMLDILEREIGEIGHSEHSVEISIDAYSILTLCVRFKT